MNEQVRASQQLAPEDLGGGCGRAAKRPRVIHTARDVVRVPLGPFVSRYSCLLRGDDYDAHRWVGVTVPAIVVVACDRGQR